MLIRICCQQAELIQEFHRRCSWNLVVIGNPFQLLREQALVHSSVTLSILICTEPSQMPTQVSTSLLVPFQDTQPLSNGGCSGRAGVL